MFTRTALLTGAIAVVALAGTAGTAQRGVLPAPVQERAEGVVQQLRHFPTPLPAAPRSYVDPVEQRRRELYSELRQLGPDALPALARGLEDPDVQLRRNVALALNVLAGTWFGQSQEKMDIRAALPALITALWDADGSVRAWSAQAIGQMGPDGARAVPSLIALLGSADEGSRNSACIALHGIGPAARQALPALEKALSDPSMDVRRFARRAVDKIRTR
jgi:HEAT repeat protein